jgi:hypothetical protein
MALPIPQGYTKYNGTPAQAAAAAGFSNYNLAVNNGQYYGAGKGPVFPDGTPVGDYNIIPLVASAWYTNDNPATNKSMQVSYASGTETVPLPMYIVERELESSYVIKDFRPHVTENYNIIYHDNVTNLVSQRCLELLELQMIPELWLRHYNAGHPRKYCVVQAWYGSQYNPYRVEIRFTFSDTTEFVWDVSGAVQNGAVDTLYLGKPLEPATTAPPTGTTPYTITSRPTTTAPGTTTPPGSTTVAPTTPKPTTKAPPPILPNMLYTRLNRFYDKKTDSEIATYGIFTDDVGTLTQFFTSSLQSAAQKLYYYEVYQSASSDHHAQPQFSVAYGHADGSGSAMTDYDYTTKAIYSQYRQLLLDPSDQYFSFGGHDSKHIYVINFNSDRFKESLDPGNIEVCLKVSGSSTFVKLIDDSGDSLQSASLSNGIKEVYNFVSGSIAGGVYSSGSPHYYGLMYPEIGIVVLNADALDVSCSFGTVTGSDVAGDNAMKLFNSISGAAVLGGGLTARNSELVRSDYVFVKIGSKMYNYSNNPTWTSGSEGAFAHQTMVRDPRVYITTIGLYDDYFQLLAVAKLSKPVLKTFANELLIKLRLKY